MKKILFSLIILMAACIAKIAASPAAVNVSNLPKDEKFKELMIDFDSAYESIRLPDVSATKSEAKEKELASASRLHDFLCKQKKANYDMQVLNLLVMRCLYNYDRVGTSEMEKEFSRINKKFPKMTAHHWVYGNYLITAGKTVDGKLELERYLEMNNYMANNLFISDYAYAQLMCNMPLNAYYTITNGGNIAEEDVEDVQLLNLIKNFIRESSSTETYKSNQVWTFARENGNFNYVYSTMLGISISCKDEWNIKVQPFTSQNPASCLIMPNELSLNGIKVGISILLLAYPESMYEDKIKQQYIDMFNITKQTKTKINNEDFEKYEFEDLSRYNDARKGAKGYLYIAKIIPQKFSGAMCEHEKDLSMIKNVNDSGNSSYSRFTPVQDRLNEPVNIIIFVDSCNALAKQTDKLIDDIFSASVFK
ncbi:MAG: hypothetical protein IJ828_08155 [Treponema sp.]|nr:hypothetical protein [Treponema sp.]